MRHIFFSVCFQLSACLGKSLAQSVFLCPVKYGCIPFPLRIVTSLWHCQPKQQMKRSCGSWKDSNPGLLTFWCMFAIIAPLVSMDFIWLHLMKSTWFNLFCIFYYYYFFLVLHNSRLHKLKAPSVFQPACTQRSFVNNKKFCSPLIL